MQNTAVLTQKEIKALVEAGELTSINSYDLEGKIIGTVVGTKEYFDKDKYLLFVGPDPSGQGTDIVRLEKGSWDIMEAIVPKVLKYVPGPIVEIGMGESSTIFAKYAQQFGVKLYSCDIIMGGMFNVCDGPIFDGHTCFLGRSEDFIKTFDDEPSVVFIDGEHLYATVKMEIDFFMPRLKEGGIFFIHDMFSSIQRHIVPDCIGRKPGDIYRIRKELERNPDIDVLTFPYSAHDVGLTLVMKHKKNKDRPEWLRNGRVDEAEECRNKNRDNKLLQ